MITTSDKPYLELSISDSTVSVGAGTVRAGNTIIPYLGGKINISEMSNFTDSSTYQTSVLCINNFYNMGDLTSVPGDPVSSLTDTVFPTLSDSTNAYSPLHAVGLFTLFTPDGTSVDLIDYSRIV